MYTEKEANGRCCPNLVGQVVYEFAYCKASECMAWRWILGKTNGNGEKLGYCGLAGRP